MSEHPLPEIVTSGGRLDATRLVEQAKRIKNETLLASDARVLGHISHEVKPTHSELSKYAEKFGCEIVYDELVIDSAIW